MALPQRFAIRLTVGSQLGCLGFRYPIPAASKKLTGVDWLWLLHPALAVALVFPLLGAVLQLALQTRRRRLNPGKGPASSGSEHTALGRWLTSLVVAIQLLAYAVVILTQKPSQLDAMRSSQLLVLAGSVLALVALWRVRQPPSIQPSGNPISGAAWGSPACCSSP